MARLDLAAQIRLERLERSWSQAHLAQVAGISLRTVQRLERTGHCSYETLLSIAQAFDVDVRDLASFRTRPGKKQFLSNIRSSVMRYVRVKQATAKQIGVVAAVLSMLVLVGVVVGTVSFFGSFYSVPPVPRDQGVIAEREGYHMFLQITGFALAVLFGLFSGSFGLWRRSYLGSLLVVGLVAALGTVAYSFLPWVIFPFDQYSAGFSWLVGNIAPLLASWGLTIFVGTGSRWFRSKSAAI